MTPHPTAHSQRGTTEAAIRRQPLADNRLPNNDISPPIGQPIHQVGFFRRMPGGGTANRKA